MIERNVKVIAKENPVLLDKVIQDIQEALTTKLEWLSYAFGRAYKLVEHRSDGSKFIYPAAYIGNSEYVSLLPNDNFGTLHGDRKSTRLNSSHIATSRMPSSA